MNQSVLELTVNTTGKEHRLLQRDILSLEHMYLSVMLKGSTAHSRLVSDYRLIIYLSGIKHFIVLMVRLATRIKRLLLCLCVSATVPLDTVGVWTAEDRRGQEPGLHLVLNPETVTDQVRLQFYPAKKRSWALFLNWWEFEDICNILCEEQEARMKCQDDVWHKHCVWVVEADRNPVRAQLKYL